MTELTLPSHVLADHAREYAHHGLTILRGAVSPALVARLRDAAELVRQLTRSVSGPAATRPPGGYVGGRVTLDFADAVDTSAFQAFEEEPVIREFVDTVLGVDYKNDHEALTVLFEAEDRELVQTWHRDYRDNVPWLDAARWATLVGDLRYFNQFNAALYHDMSLWIVPGSHNRDDSPIERSVVRQEAASLPTGTCETPAEHIAYSQGADAYIRSMPGALQVMLAPGDVAFYRDTALHLGHYIPTTRRATLHGHFENEITRQFFVDHFISPQMS